MISTTRIALMTGSVGLGGTTTFLCNFGGELVQRHIPVQVISFEHVNPLASDFSRLSVPVLCMNERHFIFEDRMRSVLDCLAQFKPDVVVANLGPLSFEVLRYLPEGVFRVGMIHTDDPLVYNTVQNYVTNMDALAAVSATIKQKAERDARFAGVPVNYLPCGVPMPEKWSVARGSAAGALRILYLGRLGQEQKRVRLFPEILKGLVDAGIPFHWTIVGEGPERPYLEATMRTVRPDQSVSFAGPVEYAAVPDFLAAHDIFLLASDYEGLPLSLLEAMGQGLVPVVSDLPSGIPEVVNDNTGKLVAPDNTAGYAEAIIALHKDREELARLSENAFARVRSDFSVGAMADRWLEAFPNQIVHDVRWPRQWQIKAPLTAGNTFQFLGPLRPLRRWLKKLSG